MQADTLLTHSVMSMPDSGVSMMSAVSSAVSVHPLTSADDAQKIPTGGATLPWELQFRGLTPVSAISSDFGDTRLTEEDLTDEEEGEDATDDEEEEKNIQLLAKYEEEERKKRSRRRRRRKAQKRAPEPPPRPPPAATTRKENEDEVEKILKEFQEHLDNLQQRLEEDSTSEDVANLVRIFFLLLILPPLLQLIVSATFGDFPLPR